MWSAKGVFCVVLCVAGIAAIGVERVAATEWVTVTSTVDAAAPVAPATTMVELVSSSKAMEAEAEAEGEAEADAESVSLSMMEVGAHMDSAESIFNSLSERGTFRLSAESQDEIVTEALEKLEEEFIRDYGTDEDRDELEQVLREDREADAALAAGDAMRFAHTEAGAAAERRRRRKRWGGGGGRGGGGGGSPADIAAQCARMGFTRGNTSPAGLAQAAGPQNAKKMGGGFFGRLGRGLKKFAGKAGAWLQKRFGAQPGLPQPPAPGPVGPKPPGPQPPAAGAGGKGWLGRLFDKVKAGANKVGGLMNKWGNKAAGWGANIAKFGNKVFGGKSKLGKFFGKVGGGMQKWGSKIGQWGGKIQAWLNGKPVAPNTKGAVIRKVGTGPPPPGAPGGQGGPKITPGMPGTYQDKNGKWRGPDGRRVYTEKQQLRRKLKMEERKAARQARKDARERRRQQRQAAREARRAKQLKRDQKHLERHLAWRKEKLEEKAERMRQRKNRLDYSGIDPEFPGAGWRLHTPEEIEDCVACRYVWLQVEMDIGNTQIEDNVYDSFNQNALEAMKQPIFYPGVQTMYDAIDDMIGDYMDGLNVNQICENSLMCRMPEN